MLGTSHGKKVSKLEKECNVVKREISMLSKEMVQAHGITFKMTQMDPSDSSEKLWQATLNLYMEDYQTFVESMMSYMQMDQAEMTSNTLKMLCLLLYYLNMKLNSKDCTPS